MRQQISGNDNYVREAAFAALGQLIANIGGARKILLFIDDLQWGDADSAGILASWFRSAEQVPLLLLGSFRIDEKDASPFWQSWIGRTEEQADPIPTSEVLVEALSETQCEHWLSSRFPEQPGLVDHVRRLYQSSKGNPYLLEQLLETFDSERGELSNQPLEEIIRGRLLRCPAGSEVLLNAVAIAGSSVSVSEVGLVAGISENAQSVLTRMRSEKLIRLIGTLDDPIVDTFHDKIRETVLDGLPIAKRQDLHRKFGEILESLIESEDENAARVYDLAHHFFEADDPRAIGYQMEAGRMALGAFAFEDAVGFLNRALILDPQQPGRMDEFELHRLLALAYQGTSNVAPSVTHFDSAKSFASTALDRADCEYG